MKDERIIFRLDGSLKEAFIAKAQAENKRYTDVLQKYVAQAPSDLSEIEQIKLRLERLEEEVKKTSGLREEVEGLRQFRARVLAATE